MFDQQYKIETGSVFYVKPCLENEIKFAIARDDAGELR